MGFSFYSSYMLIANENNRDLPSVTAFQVCLRVKTNTKSQKCTYIKIYIKSLVIWVLLLMIIM